MEAREALGRWGVLEMGGFFFLFFFAGLWIIDFWLILRWFFADLR